MWNTIGKWLENNYFAPYLLPSEWKSEAKKDWLIVAVNEYISRLQLIKQIHCFLKLPFCIIVFLFISFCSVQLFWQLLTVIAKNTTGFPTETLPIVTAKSSGACQFDDSCLLFHFNLLSFHVDELKFYSFITAFSPASSVYLRLSRTSRKAPTGCHWQRLCCCDSRF